MFNAALPTKFYNHSARATLLRSSGIIDLVSGKGDTWTEQELISIVDGHPTFCTLKNGKALVWDKDGVVKGKPLNRAATVIYQWSYDNTKYIAGDALLCDTESVY